MKMNREGLTVLWTNQSKPAVFSAVKGPAIGQSPRVCVYPLTSGRGFLWLIWHGHHTAEEMEKNIKIGGTTARQLERACKLAVHELLRYNGRPNA